jgi:hypothetical protein
MAFALVPQDEPQRTLTTATAKLKSEYVVDAAGDLTSITALCAPGSVAYTADLASMWILAADGTTWKAVV